MIFLSIFISDELSLLSKSCSRIGKRSAYKLHNWL